MNHPERPSTRRRTRAALAGLLVVLAATGTVTAVQQSRAVGAAGDPTGPGRPVPTPSLSTTAVGPQAPVTWDAPLTLALRHGSLTAIEVIDPDGRPMAGAPTGTGWESAVRFLVPAATYRITATAVDAAGTARPVTLSVRTTPASHLLHAALSPGDDAVVGVGQPVVVRLDRPVNDPEDRRAVVARLTVTSEPAVVGAWRWMADDRLHYRGAAYWPARTRVRVTADLHRLRLSDGTWGSGVRTAAFAVGAAQISTVDVNAHTMTVRRDGQVLRVLRVSTGRDEFPTHNGVHVVLEKTALKTMDSSTIGIPRGGPGGYYLKVPHSVRISYSGEFVHAAPGTVRQQGVANVSHGCVNLSPADAAWFFGIAQRGDVVDVQGSPRPPLSYDPGTSDWNTPFAQWAS